MKVQPAATTVRADAADPVVVLAQSVSRRFAQGDRFVDAVRSVTCQVRAGQQIVLSGASGSGKTTLMNLLAGLDVPTSGSITWPAIGDPSQLRPGAVAVVFQAPSLLPPLDVVENVALPLILVGTERAEANSRAIAALARLDLDELAHKLPEELSGGQSQRVAVARVLAGRPLLILADEPTGQLDHDSARVVIDTLESTAQSIGAALVVNTHDQTIVDRFATRWTMHDGLLDLTS